jgi:hypothetical protein
MKAMHRDRILALLAAASSHPGEAVQALLEQLESDLETAWRFFDTLGKTATGDDEVGDMVDRSKAAMSLFNQAAQGLRELLVEPSAELAAYIREIADRAHETAMGVFSQSCDWQQRMSCDGRGSRLVLLA